MRPTRLRPAAYAAAAALALLLVAAPAESQAPTLVTIVAADNVFRTDSGGAPTVTIAAGGHVNFTYPSGNSRHNVRFTGAQPTVCGISLGPAGDAAALPGVASPPVWEGGCDFQTPGTYAFVCDVHSSMTGSVTVAAAGTPPPADPEPQGPDVTADFAPAASGLKVAARQRGFRVRGSVLVDRAGSRVVARAFARRRALFGGRSVLDVQVGRQVRASVGGAARVTFSAALSPAARRVLRRNGRLLISLRLTVTPDDGEIYRATRIVILRPPL